MEEWKPIVDYPEYEVSSLGQVRRDGKIRNPIINVYGYYYVNLSKNNQVKHKRIHRLVAEAFIPNPESKPQVDHIDRCRTNNIVTNLRWVTGSENCLNTKSRNKQFFGIYWIKQNRKYRVSITIEKKLKHIGLYATIEEAIRMRDSSLQYIDLA